MGRRENNSDGFAFNDYRLQFSVKYSFSQEYWRTVMVHESTFVRARRAALAGASVARSLVQRAGVAYAAPSESPPPHPNIQRRVERRVREVQGPARKARTPTTSRRSRKWIRTSSASRVVTADGKVYTAGDMTTEVSIQSISKVFTMAQVIQEQGADAIDEDASASTPPAAGSTRSSPSKR